MIDLAYEEARRLNNNYIGSEHLLLGLIVEKEGLGGRMLRELGASLERTRAAVDAMQEQGEALKVESDQLVRGIKVDFQQALERAVTLSPEARALIHVLTTSDPGQLANTVASYLKLEDADRQELAPEKPPEERLQKLATLLQQNDIAFQFPTSEQNA
jgi:ATP-dependent Clp protease ATP-binding subunit ClpA